jgi:hypothetical protein
LARAVVSMAGGAGDEVITAILTEVEVRTPLAVRV